MKQIFLTVLFGFAATFAIAHSKVDTTIPANGAELSEMPAEVSFTFNNPLRLTRVEIVRPDQDTVRLDLGGQTDFANDFSLPVEGMGEGQYRIVWRGLGADGHAMQGEFSFEVK